MAASGVKVNDACVDKYNQIKMKKDLRYVMFKISDDKKSVEVESEGSAADNKYEDFVKALPEDHPRYALVDISYNTEDGRPQDKLTFVFWSPDDKVGVKEKMLYASTKDAIKKKFPGIMKELQANDADDLKWEEVEKKMLQK
eukprot:TRINITY_DN862_c0_g1_i1.p1 TRINITY_DN862_c0_g1~~TRINITY_DN862_c0_g1_i1.p1  ORF type:complete len:142 (-),score=61.19 TRINITY_DN862_c0_g1_i1:90-515(-)